MSSSQEEEELEFQDNDRQLEEFEARLQMGVQEEYQEQYETKGEMFPQITKGNKVQEIQKQLELYKKQPPKTFQEECEDVIQSKNESLKDKKLRELVQKNKILQVTLEKEKVMRQKLETQLKSAMKEAEESIKSMSLPKSQKSVQDPLQKALKPQQQEEVQADDFKSKFRDADKKVQEQRVKIQQIKSELNKAMRIISREVGENVIIDQLLLDENSWKGRAQQIEILKGKVRELTQKLGSSSQFSQVSNASRQSSDSVKNETKQQLELFKTQYDQLKQEHELLQTKFKAVSSRRSILEEQIKDSKLEYDKNKKILLEKSENDDKYIAALKQELEKIKRQSNVETKIIYKQADEDETKRLQRELSYCKDELQRNEQMIKELIAEKVSRPKFDQQVPINSDERVKKLEDELKILRKERDDFFKTLSKDTDTQKMIKDLTLQNVRLRNKLDEMKQK
ncbi:hypothetical protein pb186bvf_018334 [Paramecium bursaria]